MSGAYRTRGFGLVNLVGVAILLILMLGVYLAKTRAGADANAISRLEHQIVSEKNNIRVLQAEVARLETPERISTLSRDELNMAPVNAKQEADPANLAEIAGVKPHPPAPAPVEATP